MFFIVVSNTETITSRLESTVYDNTKRIILFERLEDSDFIQLFLTTYFCQTFRGSFVTVFVFVLCTHTLLYVTVRAVYLQSSAL